MRLLRLRGLSPIRGSAFSYLAGVLVMITLVTLAPAVAEGQQTAIVQGVVSDSAGAPLAGVAVSIRDAAGAAIATATSDQGGRYRLTGLAVGTRTARAERAGFSTVERQISLGAGETETLDFRLLPETVVLEALVAQGARGADRERIRFQNDAGVTASVVERQTLKMLPGLAEPDVLRAVQLLPGVISTSDFSSSYNVRGGSADQNLILIDGFTVFNPFHLGGLFSVFNSDAVNQAELFAGGFGAEFGGRVSSVLNIESRGDVPDKVDVYAGVSMLASRVLVHAPLPEFAASALGGEEGGSLLVSARRSYFDQLLKPVTDFPYHLTDLQTHAGISTRGGGRVSVTGYWGEDVLDLSNLGNDDEEDANDILRIRWNWGNQVIGTRLVQPLPAEWVLDTRVGFSRFAEKLSFVDFGDVNFESRIEQLLWRGDLSRDFSQKLSLRTGLAADRMTYLNLAEAGGTTFVDASGRGNLGAAYASARWRPNNKWIIEPGIRLDVWSSSDTTHTVASPRFAAKRFLGTEQNLAIKFAIGRYSQFLHSLRDEELPVSNDTWVLADKSVPPVVSDQVQLGIESFWGNGWSASVEAYARRFDGVTEFNAADDPNDPRDDLLVGKGRSRGLDLQLRRSQGKLTGWTSISLLRAKRTFPDPNAALWPDLPQEISFSPIFDRHLNADLVLQYTTNRGYELGARWNYGSGLPYTRPVAQYLSFRQSPVFPQAETFPVDDDAESLPVGVILGGRNMERYPAYHRLDVTVRRTYERSWGTFIPYLQVLNVYNQKNVLFFFYNYDKAPPVRSGFSMFPFLPALGVEVTF